MLSLLYPNWVPMRTQQAGLEDTGEIQLRDLIRGSLRKRPSRIIVQEVRSDECLELLLAVNASLPQTASRRSILGRT